MLHQKALQSYQVSPTLVIIHVYNIQIPNTKVSKIAVSRLSEKGKKYREIDYVERKKSNCSQEKLGNVYSGFFCCCFFVIDCQGTERIVL